MDIFPQARPLQVACEEVGVICLENVAHLSLLVRRNGVYARQIPLEVLKNARKSAWPGIEEVVRYDALTTATIEHIWHVARNNLAYMTPWQHVEVCDKPPMRVRDHVFCQIDALNWIP